MHSIPGRSVRRRSAFLHAGAERRQGLLFRGIVCRRAALDLGARFQEWPERRLALRMGEFKCSSVRS